MEVPTFNVYVAPSKLEIENLPIFRGNVEEVMWGESGDEDDDVEYRGDDSDAEVVIKSALKAPPKETVPKKKKTYVPPPAKKDHQRAARETTSSTSRPRKKSLPTQKKRSRKSEWRIVPTDTQYDNNGRRKNVLNFKLFSLV